RRQGDGAADPAAEGRLALVEADVEAIALPADLGGAEAEPLGAAGDAAAIELGEDPAPAAGAVDRDVEGAVIHRRRRPPPPRPRVIGREDRADESDNRQAEAPVVGEGVEVPPGVAAVGDLAVAARSSSTAAAAERPLRAAIGTPAPGWALPPAR